MSLGVGVGIGGARFDYSDLDRVYHAPNGAREVGAFGAVGVDFSAWVQIQRNFRVGFENFWGMAGSGATYTSVNAGGLLLEGGGMFGWSGWSLWGGTVLGLEGMVSRSRDEVGNIFEYRANYLHASHPRARRATRFVACRAARCALRLVQ